MQHIMKVKELRRKFGLVKPNVVMRPVVVPTHTRVVAPVVHDVPVDAPTVPSLPTEWVENQIRMFGKRAVPKIQYRQVVVETAAKYGLDENFMLMRGRKQKLVDARREAYYRLWKEHGWSLSSIGRKVMRDHTTILWGVKKYCEANGLTYLPAA